jgi:hypothetical protein
MSADAPSLAAALAAVQRRLPDVRKGETAHVRSDKGSYSYRYATLPDITKAVLPLLGENGLAWVTRPTLVDERFVLVYELLHVSGEKVSGEYPLRISGATPDESEWMTWDDKKIGWDQLPAVLRFDLDPDSLRKMENRSHKRVRDIPALFELSESIRGEAAP